MKLLTLLLSIAVLSNGLAQKPRRGFYKGTVTYANGKTEEAYIKCIITSHDHTKDKFKIIPLLEKNDSKGWLWGIKKNNFHNRRV